jgi:glycosyltransferase involved in cell wall biosynthesis
MLSCVILTKNEEKNIVDCIESVSFCDEIIVIDDNSFDNTVDLAKQNGATVFVHGVDGNFSKQRNFGLEKAKGEWVFFVDADERVSKELRNEIISKVSQKNDTEGFFIRRIDFFYGKMLSHGETAHINLLRLAKSEKGVWQGNVHETWEIKGKVAMLASPLLHYPHPTIREFLQEINFYTDLRAKELYKKKIQVSWYSIILYPKAKFLQNYIWRKGFLDGTEGLLIALMMSFHSFLVRGKLWQLWDQKTSLQ